MNVTASEQQSTPSVVPSSDLSIVEEAFVGFSIPWNVPMTNDGEGSYSGKEIASEVDMSEDNNNVPVYSPTSPAFTSPMSTDNIKQEVHGVEAPKSEAVQQPAYDTDGIAQPWDRISIL